MAVDMRAVEPVFLESTSPSVDVLIQEARRHARRRRWFPPPSLGLSPWRRLRRSPSLVTGRNARASQGCARQPPNSRHLAAVCAHRRGAAGAGLTMGREAAFVSNAPVSGLRCWRRVLRARPALRVPPLRSGHGRDPGLSGMVFLYSDGRLIVDTATAGLVRPVGAATDPRGGGASAFGCRGHPRRVRQSDRRPGRGQIHYGDDIVYPKDPQALVRLLIDRSWLPEADWVTENRHGLPGRLVPDLLRDAGERRRRRADGRPRPPSGAGRAGVARVDRAPPG